MTDQESNECLSMVQANGDVSAKTRSVYYKPIVVPGLVYRTIITSGFLQLMTTNDQSKSDKFDNVIKYYEVQRKVALDYLLQEVGKVTAKRLEVPQDEFLGWMRNGNLDFETYVILRNCMLKKGYHKRMELRKDIELAKSTLSNVGAATTKLIGKVDVKDFSQIPPVESKPSKTTPPLVDASFPTAEVFIQVNKNIRKRIVQNLSSNKQIVCGLIFGLIAAKIVCSFIVRMMPPQVE